MKAMLYAVLQSTWGVCQTVLGLALFLMNRKEKHVRYHGAIVTVWANASSVSLGLFVFIAEHPARDCRTECSIPDCEIFQRTLVHEYGHTIQSLLLGPLYLLVIGIPSASWACLFRKRRRVKGISYFSFYTEKWANRLGEMVAGEKSMEDALIG